MRRRDEVLVGLLTLVAAAILVTGTLWLARGGLSNGYPLYTRFAWGAGLKQGQPVLFSGVNVGYVDDVALLQDGGVLTTLRIYNTQQIPTGTTAAIEPNGIFGDMLIALRAPGPTGKTHAPGDTLPAGTRSVQLSDVIARVDTLGQAITKLTSALHKELIDDRAIAELRRTVVTANSMFKTLERVASEQSLELAATQASLRKAANAVDSMQIDSSLRALRATSGSVSALADDLRATSGRLNSLLARLETGNGSAARFINDSSLYEETRAVVRRVDSLVADIKANPRKYINLKFSIF